MSKDETAPDAAGDVFTIAELTAAVEMLRSANIPPDADGCYTLETLRRTVPREQLAPCPHNPRGLRFIAAAVSILGAVVPPRRFDVEESEPPPLPTDPGVLLSGFRPPRIGHAPAPDPLSAVRFVGLDMAVAPGGMQKGPERRAPSGARKRRRRRG